MFAAITFAAVPLTYLSNQSNSSDLGGALASFVPFGVVGAVAAYRQPRNVIGWLLLAIGTALMP